jgi:hypothetical protein
MLEPTKSEERKSEIAKWTGVVMCLKVKQVHQKIVQYFTSLTYAILCKGTQLVTLRSTVQIIEDTYSVWSAETKNSCLAHLYNRRDLVHQPASISSQSKNMEDQQTEL